jgi:ABC-type transporter Mla MlaB component
MTPPTASLERHGALRTVSLRGEWTLNALEGKVEGLRALLASEEVRSAERWNLSDVERLDSLGAVILWRAWADRLPVALVADSHVLAMLEAVSVLGSRPATRPVPSSRLDPLIAFGRAGWSSGASDAQVDRTDRPDTARSGAHRSPAAGCAAARNFRQSAQDRRQGACRSRLWWVF